MRVSKPVEWTLKQEDGLIFLEWRNDVGSKVEGVPLGKVDDVKDQLRQWLAGRGE